MHTYCLLAETLRQLDHAAQVRSLVLEHELGVFSPSLPLVRRELDRFDTLETTLNLVAYVGQQPVGTIRLLLPNPQIAQDNGGGVGIDLEKKLDLSGFLAPGVRPAEVGRVCILPAWRNSRVLLHLCAAMYRESLARGVTHWVGATNAETDSIEDARIAHLLARELGFVSSRWALRPRPELAPASAPRLPRYTPEERERARRGELKGLRFPRTLSIFPKLLGARYVGEPLFDPYVQRCTLPVIAELAGIPSSTLRCFETLSDTLPRAA